MAKLRRLAEETKIKLSFATSVEVREEFLTSVAGKPIHLETTITRRQFEDLIRRCWKARSSTPARRSKIARSMLGKSPRLSGRWLHAYPLVRSLIEEAFGAPIHEDVDPDLAVGWVHRCKLACCGVRPSSASSSMCRPTVWNARGRARG